MTNDKGYDWDHRWGVGFELSQKAYYSNYFPCRASEITRKLDIMASSR